MVVELILGYLATLKICILNKNRMLRKCKLYAESEDIWLKRRDREISLLH